MVKVKRSKAPVKKKKQSGSSNGWTLEKALNTDIELPGSGFNDKEKESFYLQLYNMTSSGIDIKYAFEILEKEQKKKKIKDLLTDLKSDLVQGKSLSEATQKNDKFSPYEYYSIQIGEETGQLDVVLKELTEFFKQRIKQRRQIISALSYPTIIMVASLGAIGFMLLFIIPMFEEVFDRFNGELPGVTKAIIVLSKQLRSAIPVIGLILALVVGTSFALRKNQRFQSVSQSLVAKLPLFGKIYMTSYLSRFCNSMGLLINSKVPLVTALSLVTKMISFEKIAKPLRSVESEVIKGSSLTKAMQQYSVFDSRMLAMLQVGEEVNKLGLFFNRLSDNYNEENEHRTTMLGSLLEPFLIIFLGLIVGFILIAMYLPMFNLSSTIG